MLSHKQDKHYHDIYLAPVLHKNYKKESTVFDETFAYSGSIDGIRKNIIASRAKSAPSKPNYLLGKGYYFEDSDGIIFKSADLFYRRYNVTRDVSLGVDGGLFSVYEPTKGTRDGVRYGASLFYGNFAFRLGVNQFEKFSEVVPTVRYQDRYQNHEYILEYTRQNALFYTYRVCPVDEQITTDHFAVSDYATFDDKTNLWSNLTANNYSNGDLELIGQFDWRFYYGKIDEKFTYDFALEGYYVFNSKPNDCFYSPDFNDNTLLRVDPDYRWNRYIGLRGMAGAGYSFKSNQLLYKYGAWLYGNPLDDLSYTLGCLESNSARSGLVGKGYYYHECKAELGYRW